MYLNDIQYNKNLYLIGVAYKNELAVSKNLKNGEY